MSADWKIELESLFEGAVSALVLRNVRTYTEYWTNYTDGTGEISNGDYLTKSRGQYHPRHLQDITRYIKTKDGQEGVRNRDQMNVLNLTMLTKESTEYAEHQVAKIAAKITAKIEELDSVEKMTLNLQSLSFVLTGTRAGKSVRLEQNAVFKVSSKDTLFVAFPARFRVDGKATTEAAYKKMFTEEIA